MSALLMGQVWRVELDHAQRILALALADHADDQGCHIYPGIEYLMWKTDYSERQIRRILRSLETLGLIVPVGYAAGGRGHATEYRMDISAIPVKAPFQKLSTQAGDDGNKGGHSEQMVSKGGHFQQGKGDISGSERGTNPVTKGDIPDTKGDISGAKGGHSYGPPTISKRQEKHQEPSEKRRAPARGTFSSTKKNTTGWLPENPGRDPTLPARMKVADGPKMRGHPPRCTCAECRTLDRIIKHRANCLCVDCIQYGAVKAARLAVAYGP